MACYYAPLNKRLLKPGQGECPPVNGTVKVRIWQRREDETLVTDSIEHHPYGYSIDFTSTTVQAPLVDELMQMREGELASFTTAEGERFSSVQPDIHSIEVEMLSHRGQDVSAKGDGSLIKSIQVEGMNRSKPFWTGKCRLLIQKGSNSGEEVQAVVLRLGDGDTYGVPPEIEQCAITMTKGEECRLVTPSSNFTITLSSLERDLTEKEIYNLPSDELITKTELTKKSGNFNFQKGKLHLASLYYNRALRYLDNRNRKEEDSKQTNALEVACHLNLAQVYLRTEEWQAAIASCNKAFWIEPDNVKGLFRRARALCALRFYEESQSDLKKLIGMGENGSEIRALMEEVVKGRVEMARSEGVSMRAVLKQIEKEENKELTEPVKSVWDEAEETCPAELASEEAYAAYTGKLAEEERIRKEKEAADRAAYEAANPPKKKKKRKKKKKADPAVVAVTETEVVQMKEEEEEKEPEIDEGMEYRVAQEKTIVNKGVDVIYEGQVVNDGTAGNGLPTPVVVKDDANVSDKTQQEEEKKNEEVSEKSYEENGAAAVSEGNATVDCIVSECPA